MADHLTATAFVAALVDDPSAALRAYVEPLAENENRNGLASAARAAAEGVLRVAADDAEAAARAWMAETERAVLACAEKNDTENMGLRKNASSVVPRLAPDAIRAALARDGLAPEPAAGEAAAAGFAPRADRDAYVRAIVASQDFIDAGETYEVCLTNQLVRGERTKNEAEERKKSARSALGSKRFPRRRTRRRCTRCSAPRTRRPTPRTCASAGAKKKTKKTNTNTNRIRRLFPARARSSERTRSTAAATRAATLRVRATRRMTRTKALVSVASAKRRQTARKRKKTKKKRVGTRRMTSSPCAAAPRTLPAALEARKHKPRARPGGEADQRHGAATRSAGVRRRYRRGGGAGGAREGPSRELDDRRFAAQRLREGVRAGFGVRPGAHEDRELRHRAPAGEHRARDAETERSFSLGKGGSGNRIRVLDRVRRRGVPTRVDDRRAESADVRNHRVVGGRAARRL